MKEAVQNLINDLEKDNPGAEAVALFQNGETVLSKHFTPDRPRLIYSHTKSFVSTLAGMAIDEGKLTAKRIDVLGGIAMWYRPMRKESQWKTFFTVS